MDAWTSMLGRLVLLIFCIICETKAQIRPDRGTYVSRGDITPFTALNLTEKDVYDDRFTVTWVPVSQSWNVSEVTYYRLSVRVTRGNIEQYRVITINDVNSNIYTVFSVTPEDEYYVILYATRCHDAPDYVSNTLMIRPGRDVPYSFKKVFLISIVILLWIAALIRFFCTWNKKMTLRPTYEMTSTSESPYDVIKPGSYNYMHTQRSNSYTPEMSHQLSGSSLQCPTKSYLSRSFNDLHTVIPEDSPMLLTVDEDAPSSSGYADTKT